MTVALEQRQATGLENVERLGVLRHPSAEPLSRMLDSIDEIGGLHHSSESSGAPWGAGDDRDVFEVLVGFLGVAAREQSDCLHLQGGEAGDGKVVGRERGALDDLVQPRDRSRLRSHGARYSTNVGELGVTVGLELALKGDLGDPHRAVGRRHENCIPAPALCGVNHFESTPPIGPPAACSRSVHQLEDPPLYPLWWLGYCPWDLYPWYLRGARPSGSPDEMNEHEHEWEDVVFAHHGVHDLELDPYPLGCPDWCPCEGMG